MTRQPFSLFPLLLFLGLVLIMLAGCNTTNPLLGTSFPRQFGQAPQPYGLPKTCSSDDFRFQYTLTYDGMTDKYRLQGTIMPRSGARNHKVSINSLYLLSIVDGIVTDAVKIPVEDSSIAVLGYDHEFELSYEPEYISFYYRLKY